MTINIKSWYLKANRKVQRIPVIHSEFRQPIYVRKTLECEIRSYRILSDVNSTKSEECS